MLIDTHCHLEMPHFDEDRDDVVARATTAGVGRLLTVGTNLADSHKVIRILSDYPAVFGAVGIHPHDSREATPDNLAKLAALTREQKVVALGEIGLDFFKNYAPRDVQWAAFEAQLALADELGLPLILHDRDAHEPMLDYLEKSGRAPFRGVFHCFSGEVDHARRAFDLGFYLSFTGTITFKKERTSHDVLRMAPRDRVMVETDCPYLTPVPYRGRKRNEPAFVTYVAQKVAELWSIDPEEVARITTDNAYRLFGFETSNATALIAYPFKDNLYLNLTNRCSNACTFCAKWSDYMLGPHFLRLDAEPDVSAICEAAGDMADYPEVVFCGYGEPTERMDTLCTAAQALKDRGATKIRLNTNGQADLIHNQPTAHRLEGLFDAVSVSLNAQDADTYQRLCRSQFGQAAYEAVKAYIRAVKRYVPEVTASVVRLPGVDIEACRRIADEELGVRFRVRG